MTPAKEIYRKGVAQSALKRAEAGLSVPDLCRELGISSATFYKWRAKYGGMDASLMARMLKAEVVAEALAKKW